MNGCHFLIRLAAVTILCGGAGSLRAEPGYTRKIEVKTLVRTSHDAAGQPIHYPSGGTPEVACLEVTIPVGENTGWHTHPVQCVGYVQQGKIEVETSDGKKQIYQSGDCIPEMVNRKHCGTNIGTVPVRILLVVIGQKGTPVSVSAK